MKHLDISLSGKVQRIGLRYQITQAAESYGIHGYARNLRDGSVFIEAEGSDEDLEAFVSWLQSSPGLSQIKACEVKEGDLKGFKDFQKF